MAARSKPISSIRTRRGNHQQPVGNPHKSLSKRTEVSAIRAPLSAALLFRKTRRTHNQQGRNARSSAVPVARNRAQSELIPSL
jgi:hypothetical protein